MIDYLKKRTPHILLLTGCLFIGLLWLPSPVNQPVHTSSHDASSLLVPEKASKAARWSYFFNMLRSPSSNAIPTAVRYRELQHAQAIKSELAFKTQPNQMDFSWFEVGPSDVGGRTRALAIDLDNPDRMIAGGVSGGLWESTNNGLNWSPLNQEGGNLSVTYIAQDPRPGSRNIWYYASGEFSGNSASDPGRVAPYYGSGLYKSMDNGETWSLLPAATPNNLNRFDSPFDFVNRIAISPTTGTLFVASNALGIYRSDDGGNDFGPDLDEFSFPGPVLGGVNQHDWSDVAVNEDGVVLAVISSEGSETPTNSPGVYISNNDGLSWVNITPNTFPNNHDRSIVAFVPSNQDMAFVFTTTLAQRNGREDVRLHKIDVTTGASTNLSANLPNLSDAGDIDTQGGYNMALAVKPDDEDFVILGGTNVYRSRNGFSTSVVERTDFWIGGYDAISDRFVNYENHHPDQHIFLFDPRDANRLWTGNDGGIYVLDDVTVMNEVDWSDRNNGYNVTQFYTVALAPEAQDPRIAGGSQDNGTPYLRLDDLAAGSRNISVGDGTYLYFAEAAAYVGFQNGSILKLGYNAEDTPTLGGFSFIQPESASSQLFVNPFIVDPNNEDVMYYPSGSTLWRNNMLSSLRGGQTDSEGSDEGWSRVNGIPFVGLRTITAIAVSQDPAHILYYGASDTRANDPASPQLFRMEDATTSTGNNAVSISLPSSIEGGAYISDIAINPEDADEILVVFSNYEIVGLYHSTNGGASFTAVEGNLEGTGSASPGPSIRAATILPLGSETRYLVGTSTGLYSTTDLNGSNTVWTPEAPSTIGNSVVWDVTSRTSDNLVAVATHGRGLYVGSEDDSFNPTPNTDEFVLAPNFPNPFASTTTIIYDLPTQSRVSISVFNLAGRKIQDLLIDEVQETGRQFIEFNAASFPSGVYLYQLRAIPVGNDQNLGTFTKSRKMMIIK